MQGLRDDEDAVPRILHWTAEFVWLGDVSFALPRRGRNDDEGGSASEVEQSPPHSRYARAPWRECRNDLEKRIRAGELVVTKLVEPEHWRRAADSGKDLIGKNGPLPVPMPLQVRRDYATWAACEKQRWSLIEPLMLEYKSDIGRILEDEVYGTWAALRSRELGLKSTRAVRDALHRCLIGLGRQALMPAYQYRGAPGHPRYLSGWDASEGVTQGGSRAAPYLTTACDRVLLHNLYRKHVKPRVSHEQAYELAIRDGWSESMEYLPNGDVRVVPKARVPSLQEFIRWGRTALDGSNRREQEQRKTGLRNPLRLRGNELLPTGPRIGVLSQIDSTSCDQTLVSEAWRGKLLPSPWCTRLIEPELQYTYGIYVGFDAPSALTAKLTILNAAEDKCEYCARHDIELESLDDWISNVGTKVEADWGELSAQESQIALEDIEGSVIYAPSYFPEGKASVESEHHSKQRRYDHRNPGSSHGRQKQRGERSPAKDACLTPFEYTRGLIKETLRSNNEAYAPPQYLEMVRDGVGPTRKEQVLWCREKGYLTSGFQAIESLRIRCLPKVQASIGPEGIRLFDPSQQREALLDPTFFSRELAEAGYLARTRKRCWVRIDPATIAHIWLDGRKLIKVPLNTRDPLMHRLTWADVMVISHDKKLAHYLYRTRNFAKQLSHTASMDHRAKVARQLRDAQTGNAGASNANANKPSTKKRNRDEEIGYTPPDPVVLHDATTHRPRLFVVGAASIVPRQMDDPFDNLMETIRSAR